MQSQETKWWSQNSKIYIHIYTHINQINPWCKWSETGAGRAGQLSARGCGEQKKVKDTKAKAGGWADTTLSPRNLRKGWALNTRVSFLGCSPMFSAIMGGVWVGLNFVEQQHPAAIAQLQPEKLQHLHFSKSERQFLYTSLLTLPGPQVQVPWCVSGREHTGTGHWKRGRALLHSL